MKQLLSALLLLAASCLPATLWADKGVSVHGTYTLTIGDNDDITLRDAKRKCIEMAKADAIKKEFGELVSSDVMDQNVEVNGESVSSYYWENTVAQARGTWLADRQPAQLNIVYSAGKLIVSAEVWGEAREIKQAQTELEWDIMKPNGDKRVKATQFGNRERIYVTFRAPADGYVAVYLLEGHDETSCLLPYPKDNDGKFPIKGGKSYTFFDKTTDQEAVHYVLKTAQAVEDNELIIIYSPNPFVKCNDKSNDPKRPGQLNTRDFQKWLLKCQRADEEMVVNKRWVKIVNADK